jgi:ring-1,2-phenylacetyl-CoA epoxidase subunit PaaC
MSGGVVEYALRLGDDALIAAQRLGEWSARAPEMELDVALSNIALDQLGVARLMLSYAAESLREATSERGTSEAEAKPYWLDGDEDSLAYLRDAHEFRNCLLVELPNAGPAADFDAPGDFGVTMVKLLMLSAYQVPTYEWLATAGPDRRLAEIAAKARKESAYHLDLASLWTVRLGDGTDESHRRMQAAIDDVWPYGHELFESDEVVEAGLAPDPVEIRSRWLEHVEAVLATATLTRPADGWAPTGGRTGRHTEHLSRLLAEMQVLHRAHPGARW